MVVCEQLRVRFPPKASQLFPDGQFALVASCRSLEPVIPRQKTRGGVPPKAMSIGMIVNVPERNILPILSLKPP